MYRARIEKVAKELAREQGHGACFGLSVFGAPDGFQNWLVGSPAELEKAGVPAAVVRNRDGVTFAEWFKATECLSESNDNHVHAWRMGENPERWRAFYTGRTREID